MNAPRPIKVLIADDHALICEGLKHIIPTSGEFIVSTEAHTVLSAPQPVHWRLPHLMLLDISLRDQNGIEVLKQARVEFPSLPVLMLSMHREDPYALRAMGAGATGYLNKRSAPDELIGAMRTVAKGQNSGSIVALGNPVTCLFDALIARCTRFFYTFSH